MSTGGGTGRGGTALFASPGRLPRAVAFAPAVRGYPGGIADMAGDLAELAEGEPFGDGELWAIAPAAAPGDAPDHAEDASAHAEDAPDHVRPAGPMSVRPARDESRQAQPEPAEPVSVWQQSAAAWQEAGIDWLPSASAGSGAVGSTSVASTWPRLESTPSADDDPHTEPIPVIPADAPPGPAAPAAVPKGRARKGRKAVEAGEVAGAAAISAGDGATVAARPAAVDAAATDRATAGAASLEEPAAGASTDEPTGGAASTEEPTVGAASTEEPSVGASPGEPTVGADAEEVTAGVASLEELAAGASTEEPTVAAGAEEPATGVTGAEEPTARAGAEEPTAGPASVDEPPSGITAGPDALRENGSGPSAAAGAPGRTRRGRRTAVVAAAAVLLLAGTVAAIGIARSGGTGPARPEFTLVTPYQPAVPADADFTGPAAGATPLLPSLTGIAAAGETVVAIGAQPSQSGTVPLMLLSIDGGHTWARASVAAASVAGPGAPPPGATPGPTSGLATGHGTATGPGPAAGQGAAGPAAGPALIARGGSTWLALGQHTAWTSPDGKVWQPAPGVPEAAGDKVLGLAGTGTGFVAVGEHTGSQPGPVVWTSADGRAWLRESAPALGLTARGGQVTALRWVAARGGVILAAGRITAARRHRPVAGLWRSTDGGHTWHRVTLPATHGATNWLAGLATNGSTFLAVRPGRARPGRPDAVAYLSVRGSRWVYAGKLTPHRRTPMRVTDVAGSSHGFAVAAVTRSGQLAFLRARGRRWRQIADPGRGVAGLTAVPGGKVVVAGNGRLGPGAAGVRPHLLLTAVGGRRQVGRSALTAAGTPDITVNALASAGRAQVAVGAADGAPAVWLASAGGRWAPAGLRLPGSWRSGALLSVVRGGSGWLATGQTGTGAPYQPMILTSASGTTWTAASGTGPLTAPGTSLAAAAAGPAGYVVAGSTLTGGRPEPAAWFSADLSTWARARLPSAGAGAQLLAVTAARSGFVAAGVAGASPAVWTSSGGTAWRIRTLPRPAGATSAALTRVTATAGKVVAIGDAYRGPAAGPPVPFAAVTADGGRSWRESVLPAPPGPAVVTALAAAGHGFVAVGHPGLPGQPGLLAWWSADGLIWHHAGPAGGGVPGPFVTQINALTAGNGTVTGAGFAASGSAEHPVLWHARYR